MNRNTFITANFDWKCLFDAIDIPVFLINEQLRIIECNQKAVELYGYTESEFKMLWLCDIYAPYTLNEIAKLCDKNTKDLPVVFDTRHIKKDGSEFYVKTDTRQIIIENDPFYIHLVKDISRWKQTELKASLYHNWCRQ